MSLIVSANTLIALVKPDLQSNPGEGVAAFEGAGAAVAKEGSRSGTPAIRNSDVDVVEGFW